jgi:LuxR family maltose regulon positive regulatory protein
LGDVTAWLESNGFRHTDKVSLINYREYLYLARALTECGRVNEALLLLEHMYEIVNSEDRLRGKIEVSILQSIALHRKGDRANALIKLETALQWAEPGGYIRSFIDEGARMADLLSHYLHLRQRNLIHKSEHVSIPYVKKLLIVMKSHIDESFMPVSLITEQELKIIRMIEKGLSNNQIAEQIQVTVETVNTHIKNIYRKLGVHSRLQAVQRGKKMKIL